MNGSPLYTLLLQQAGVKGIYSIGRVQTPTLYMIYQRDLAIENFKPEPYFELNAKVSVNSQNFDAKLDPTSDLKMKNSKRKVEVLGCFHCQAYRVKSISVITPAQVIH